MCTRRRGCHNELLDVRGTAYFQTIMAEVLTILIGQACFVCVDDAVSRAKDAETLMYRLEYISVGEIDDAGSSPHLA